MQIGSKEHYDILDQFERNYRDLNTSREDKFWWIKGIVYQDDLVNQLYKAYISGYSFGKTSWQQ